MKLLNDIEKCIADAKSDGKAAFTILGGGLQPPVRANLHYHGRKGFVLILAQLDQKKMSEIDAENIVTMFAAQAFGPLGEYAFAKEEQGGPPGGKLLWHRVYALTEAKS